MTIDNGLYREQVASGIYQCEFNLFVINISSNLLFSIALDPYTEGIGGDGGEPGDQGCQSVLQGSGGFQGGGAQGQGGCRGHWRGGSQQAGGQEDQVKLLQQGLEQLGLASGRSPTPANMFATRWFLDLQQKNTV